MGTGPDLGEDGSQVAQRRTGEDLSPFHGLPGCDVQGGHVIADISITDDRKDSGNGHSYESLPFNSGTCIGKSCN